jgi:hypothetical protein
LHGCILCHGVFRAIATTKELAEVQEHTNRWC